MKLADSIERLTCRMRQTLPPLRAWQQEDLVQEVYLRALVKLEQFRGESSLKTWVFSLARNHLIGMARASRLRAPPGGDLDDERSRETSHEGSSEVRREVRGVLEWLSSEEGRAEVPRGREVLTLLLRSSGNWEWAATALTVATRDPWTVQKVRAVARKIRATGRGRALCATAGLGG